jgi:hypothetical protein
MIAANVFADTNIYLCLTPDGKVEFRQTSCAKDTEENEITVEDRKTGWEPKLTKIARKRDRVLSSRIKRHTVASRGCISKWSQREGTARRASTHAQHARFRLA